MSSITVFQNAAARENIKVLPTSFSQEGIWILEQLASSSALNTLSATVQVNQWLDVQILERSLEQLVQRHDTLRTTFTMKEGQLMQLISPHMYVPVMVHDLRELPEMEQQTQAEHLSNEQAHQPFALEQGPLLRCSLVLLAREQSLLLLNLHLAVSDLLSMDVLVHDLAWLYDASQCEEPSSLPPLPHQYVEVTRWQREERAEEILAGHLAYWKQQLAEPPALELPTDYPQPVKPSRSGATLQTVLPRTLGQYLEQLSYQQQTNLEVTLQAAFAALLSRYSGQEDLLIGAEALARSETGSETLIGPFENLLPLRVDLSGSPSFLELLERVRSVREAAAAHEELPFEVLLKELHPNRTLGHNALCRVMLRLSPPQPDLPAGWKLAQLEEGPGSTQFDLALELQEGEQGLITTFKYRTDLFEEATIRRIAGHWQTLLAGIETDPGQSLAHLPLLTAQERAQLLEEWTATQKAYPQQGLPQLFEIQVEHSPEAIAVACEGVQVTYQELNRQANQLAHYLREQGVGPETLVAILAERGIPFLRAILAIFKAGGAYLPLDPHHPPARLRRVIEQSCCKLVLTTSDFTATLAQAVQDLPNENAPGCLTLEDLPLAEQPQENLPPCSSPRDLAYVIYTSGSTGLPKGAMVEQRGMLNHLCAKIEALNLSERDIVAQTASQCFDISVWQFLSALLVGGRVQIYPDAIAHDALELLHQVDAHQVSILETVPSLLSAMLDAQQSEGARRPALAALRWLVPTGEALPVELCRRWLARYPRVPLLNAYGPTECSDDVTHYVVSQPPQETCRSIPIGKAIPNIRLYVLDRHMEPLPIGVSGELYVGGIGVGRGYLGDEQRTAEAFVQDPFNNEEGARLYKTGDRARYLPDGNLEFLGRLDHQVKLRGYRIELGEIEAILSQQAGVRQAVVLVREDAPGEQRLVAYVVPEQGANVTIEELKRLLAQQVPGYMVPAAFVLLEHLPLTANGKLDRKALPVPERNHNERQENYVAPTSPLQQQVAEIWEDLLGIHPIGIRDDFFELGGDSLLAVRLFERIAQVSGKRLSLATLFAGATIEHVASVLEQEESQQEQPGSEERTALVVVQAGGSRRPFFYLHGEFRGGAFYSRELARRMGPEQPFYLLEPYKFDGLAVPPSFEEMAAAHLKVMRRVQPEGPYMLGGWCNGGLMAYEMARQLHAQGQAVDLLLLMDPDAPARHRWVRRAISRVCSILRIGEEQQFKWFLYLQHIYRYMRFSHYRQTKNAELLGTGEQDAADHTPGNSGPASQRFRLKALIPKVESLRQEYLNMYDWPATDYAPDLYPGKITFFWTSEEPWRPVGWQKVVKAKEREVEIHMLPGNHITCRTEHLPVLAEHVRACLSKAQAAATN